MKHKCLSIAGFDGSGGAGIQADLKTFSAFGCYGMTVLTSLTVQNTCGVKSFHDIPLKSIQEQLEAIFEDIVPDSIKIGLLFSSKIMELVGSFLEKNAKHIPIVLDPVMVAKSGDALLLPDAVEALKTKVIPLATIITPNIPEAYALTWPTISDERPITLNPSLPTLVDELLKLGPRAVLLKGGHLKGEESNDLFMDNTGHKIWLNAPRIHSRNTHGTGCTLSAAICSCLALGFSLTESCKIAKRYLFEAIKTAKENSMGKGHGPVQHFYHLWPTIEKI